MYSVCTWYVLLYAYTFTFTFTWRVLLVNVFIVLDVCIQSTNVVRCWWVTTNSIQLLTSHNIYRYSEWLMNMKHLKNVGPIRYCEPPLHCQSPGVASRTPATAISQAACDVHDIDDDNDNAWQGTAMAPWNGPSDWLIPEEVWDEFR